MTLGGASFTSASSIAATRLEGPLSEALQTVSDLGARGVEVPGEVLRSASLLRDALSRHAAGATRLFANPAASVLPGGIGSPLLDPVGAAEWRLSVQSEMAASPEVGLQMLRVVVDEAQRHGVFAAVGDQRIVTPQVNSIPATHERPHPGDLRIERDLLHAVRWNAAMMVDGANERFPGIGGHLGTLASNAKILVTLMLHFFRGKDHPLGGDHLFIQGHDSPGVYALQHLLGRFTDDQLLRFRREVGTLDAETGDIAIDAGQGLGLSSYPHPYLMPEDWEFHSVSMGLAPQLAIHQARVDRWLAAQEMKDASHSRVWAILGDGSMEEPEAQADLHIAGTEKLPVKFLINCNLQRLDGPVRGNGNIMLELESRYRAAGWKVIKVITGGLWDDLLSRDTDGRIAQRMSEIPDGQFQTFATKDGAYIREVFFGKKGLPQVDEAGTVAYPEDNPELLKLIEGMSDDDIKGLNIGGHDFTKVWNAMKAAEEHDGPVAVLFRTVKGYAMGESQASMSIHGLKHTKAEARRALRDRLGIPLSDDEVARFAFWHPGEESEIARYLRERREVLGGPAPRRVVVEPGAIEPLEKTFLELDAGSGTRDLSTTMAWMSLYFNLMSDPEVGRYFTEVVADEIDTFGGRPHIAKFGIHSPTPQLYLPADHKYTMVRYREGTKGRIWQMGISEAAAISAFTALGTAYATHGVPIIPAFILYSKFLFQRVGDQIWGAGDMRTRGFLIGATAGRTTLNGEGLQHEDGESHLVASAYPRVRPYDPAFAYEMAAIARDGVRRFFGAGPRSDEIVYMTAYNENYVMPPRPAGVTDDMILSGLYLFRPADDPDRTPASDRVQLLGSGSILPQALKAQEILRHKYGVDADVWSATSYPMLARQAEKRERDDLLHPERKPETPLVTQLLGGRGPVVAVSDYVKALPRLVASWVPQGMTALGTDGYGRSDLRAVLRRFFGNDAQWIALASLSRLEKIGGVATGTSAKALRELGIDPNAPYPPES